MVQFIVGRLEIENDETVRFAFALPISALYHFALRHPSARDQALPSDVFRIEDLHLDCWFLHECFQRRDQQSAADITDSGLAQARIPSGHAMIVQFLIAIHLLGATESHFLQVSESFNTPPMSMLQHICLGTIGLDDFFQDDIGLTDVDTDLSLAAAFGAAT